MTEPKIAAQLDTLHLFIVAVWVFFAMFALDSVFALYVLKIASKSVLHASILAGIIQCLHVFVITSYVRDKIMALPAVLGAFGGTWFMLDYLG